MYSLKLNDHMNCIYGASIFLRNHSRNTLIFSVRYSTSKKSNLKLGSDYYKLVISILAEHLEFFVNSVKRIFKMKYLLGLWSIKRLK